MSPPVVNELAPNSVLVFSGKGGVGKSTIAANIALGITLRGRDVGLLDVDIHGPNLPKILGVEDKHLSVDEHNKIHPVMVTPKLKLISIAYMLPDPSTPIIWRGPMKHNAIRQLLEQVDWGKLDWLIIDSPPGTGDEPLSVAQLLPATSAIVVTTPQELSLLDCRKAVNFAKRLNLKLLGVIENMSTLICPHCGKPIDIFRRGGGTRISTEMGIPLLGSIPMDIKIVEASDYGKPFVIEYPDSPATQAIMNVVDKMLQLEVPPSPKKE